MGLLSKAAGNLKPALTKTPLSLEYSEKIEKQVSLYQLQYQEFNCIVFGFPSPVDRKNDLSKKLGQMLNHIGVIVPLALERRLILLPPSTDRELIAHRLSRNLNTLPLLSFKAKGAQSVLNQIESLS